MAHRARKYTAHQPVRFQANREISAARVRVIGEDGKQLGILPLEEALKKAIAAELDLVEVAPNSEPPVCRIMDYGKQIYMEEKKRREARKKSHARDMKAVRLKPRIGLHDLDIKVERARSFLAEGRRVRFEMQYRGREMAHMEIGRQIMNKVLGMLSEIAKMEGGPYREGRRISMVLAPLYSPEELARMKEKKKKKQQATASGRTTAAADGERDGSEEKSEEKKAAPVSDSDSASSDDDR